jgi:hypothetical protein
MCSACWVLDARGHARTRVCQSAYNTGYLSFLLFALLHSPLVLIETLHTHARGQYVCAVASAAICVFCNAAGD